MRQCCSANVQGVEKEAKLRMWTPQSPNSHVGTIHNCRKMCWFLQSKMIPLNWGGRGQHLRHQDQCESVGWGIETRELCGEGSQNSMWSSPASPWLEAGLNICGWELLRLGTQQLLWTWDEKGDAGAGAAMAKRGSRPHSGFLPCQSGMVSEDLAYTPDIQQTHQKGWAKEQGASARARHVLDLP